MLRIGSVSAVLLLGCLACRLVISTDSTRDAQPTATQPRLECTDCSERIPNELESPEKSLSSGSVSRIFDFSPIDGLVRNAIERRQIPGCVIAIGRHNRVLFTRAYGDRARLPQATPMSVETIFDLASLTKPIATATSIMLLVEKGLVDLDRPVAEYLPQFAAGGKTKVTVRQIMIHSAGLPKVNPLRDYEQGGERALARLLETRPIYTAGAKYLYSDIGYLILGELVRRVSGLSLEVFAERNIFSKLGMEETFFRLPEKLKPRAAPTEQRNDQWIVGEVHDPRAFRLGGVAGNAGLFSTAGDLSRYTRMMLNEGSLDGSRILSRRAVQEMTEPHFIENTVRGLGWDIRSDYSVNRGGLLSARAFGHGGYTGTAIWIDPGLDLFVVFLSNRVHPDGHGDANRLAGAVANVAVRALSAYELSSHSAEPRVKTGIDVLQEQRFETLRGKRVGLITNATGRNSAGISTIDLLRRAAGVNLVAVFAPEHGLKIDREGAFEHEKQPQSETPIYSLFGKYRKPTSAMLEGIDILVFDIQDVGTRFFTYMSTLHQVLLAAAEHGQNVVVLDRPNPINGEKVEGPLPDAGVTTFVNYFPLPIRHGMTVGELARLINSQRAIHAKLEIVKLQGWNRAHYYDQTGLAWVNPSPNIRSPMQALLYPAIGLLESTNLSVGRGTDSPFEVFGAPWLNANKLVYKLHNAGLPGVTFTPITFTPRSDKYKDQLCRGVRVAVIDRFSFLPVRTAFQIAHCLLSLHKGKWTVTDFVKLVVNQRVMKALIGGFSPSQIERIWEADLHRFYKRRAGFLLYPGYPE
ncbi:MAG: DUF1343 domain-containing protein [Deltaproteobacteria bacterium]|nr:DUF1343 domain-containing protein [Deltaproteobacteria bacterium]